MTPFAGSMARNDLFGERQPFTLVALNGQINHVIVDLTLILSKQWHEKWDGVLAFGRPIELFSSESDELDKYGTCEGLN